MNKHIQNALDFQKSRLKHLREKYSGICADISYEFSVGRAAAFDREVGPAWEYNSMEGEWRALRTQIRDLKDFIAVLEALATNIPESPSEDLVTNLEELALSGEDLDNLEIRELLASAGFTKALEEYDGETD